jgi:hypothetical protein
MHHIAICPSLCVLLYAFLSKYLLTNLQFVNGVRHQSNQDAASLPRSQRTASYSESHRHYYYLYVAEWCTDWIILIVSGAFSDACVRCCSRSQPRHVHMSGHVRHYVCCRQLWHASKRLDLGLLTRAGSQPHQVASRYQQPWDGKLRHHTSIYFILATYAGSNARRYRLLCVGSHRGPVGTGRRSWVGGPDGSDPYRCLDAGGTTRVGDGQNRWYVATCRDLLDLCFFFKFNIVI